MYVESGYYLDKHCTYSLWHITRRQGKGGRNFQRKEFYRFYGTHDHKPINLAQGQTQHNSIHVQSMGRHKV